MDALDSRGDVGTAIRQRGWRLIEISLHKLPVGGETVVPRHVESDVAPKTPADGPPQVAGAAAGVKQEATGGIA